VLLRQRATSGATRVGPRRGRARGSRLAAPRRELHGEGLHTHTGKGIGYGREIKEREERGAHHGLNGRQQPLTGIQPRARGEVEEREREVTAWEREIEGEGARIGGWGTWACAQGQVNYPLVDLAYF
jgi:hypothetical protein